MNNEIIVARDGTCSVIGPAAHALYLSERTNPAFAKTFASIRNAANHRCGWCKNNFPHDDHHTRNAAWVFEGTTLRAAQSTPENAKQYMGPDRVLIRLAWDPNA